MSDHSPAVGTYYLVFAALISLTALTIGLSFVDLHAAFGVDHAVDWPGIVHTLAGVAIAATKALLVALFFMHIIRSSRLTWIVILSGVFWLGILMTLTLADYLSRPWIVY